MARNLETPVAIVEYGQCEEPLFALVVKGKET